MVGHPNLPRGYQNQTSGFWGPSGCVGTADSRRHDPRFQKQDVGSWKLEVGFSQLCSLAQKKTVDLVTEKAPGTELAKFNFQLLTSNFLFLQTEGHAPFSNPLCYISPIGSSVFQISIYFPDPQACQKSIRWYSCRRGEDSWWGTLGEEARREVER